MRWGVALLRASFCGPGEDEKHQRYTIENSTFGTSSNSRPAAALIHRRSAHTYPQESTFAPCHASDLPHAIPRRRGRRVQQTKMRRRLEHA
jgi:hypothetical protein